MFLLSWVDRINATIGKIISFLIWIGMAIIVYEVIARYVFNYPSVWAPGYTQRVFAAYFVLIGAFTLIQGGHVRVDLLLNTRSPRWNAFADLLNCSVLLIWGLALSYEAWPYFYDAWEWGDTDDSALGHPMWPVMFALLMGVVMITVQAVVEILRSLILMIRPDLDTKRRGVVV